MLSISRSIMLRFLHLVFETAPVLSITSPSIPASTQLPLGALAMRKLPKAICRSASFRFLERNCFEAALKLTRELIRNPPADLSDASSNLRKVTAPLRRSKRSSTSSDVSLSLCAGLSGVDLESISMKSSNVMAILVSSCPRGDTSSRVRAGSRDEETAYSLAACSAASASAFLMSLAFA